MRSYDAQQMNENSAALTRIGGLSCKFANLKSVLCLSEVLGRFLQLLRQQAQ